MRDLTAHVAGWFEHVGSLSGEARAHARAGVTWSITDIAWPMFNAGVAAPDADADTVAAALEELRGNGLPWFWFVLPQTPDAIVEQVRATGAIAFDEQAPWMEAERTALPTPEAPAGATVVECITTDDVQRWAATLRRAYEFPDAGRECWAEAALRRTPDAPQFRLWLVTAGDKDVAVTLGFVADGIVAQFGVGVLAEERGRGYGRLVTLIPPAELEAPVAGHWATPDGERLYRRLGMVTDGWVTRYVGGMAEIPVIGAGGPSAS